MFFRLFVRYVHFLYFAKIFGSLVVLFIFIGFLFVFLVGIVVHFVIIIVTIDFIIITIIKRNRIFIVIVMIFSL